MEERFLEDHEIDELIERVKERNEEIERLEDIAKQRIEKIEFELGQKVEKLQNQNQFDLQQAKISAERSGGLKETKTQFKKTFLAGDLVIKKAKTSVKKPKSSDVETLVQYFPEYKKTKTVEELDWKKLKGRLQVVGDKVIDTDTGEDVTDKFEIDAKDEEIIVK